MQSDLHAYTPRTGKVTAGTDTELGLPSGSVPIFTVDVSVIGHRATLNNAEGIAGTNEN